MQIHSPAAPPTRSPAANRTATPKSRQQQQAESALRTLTVANSAQKDDAKAIARKKVDELKARMQHLRLIYASDPKGLARAAAALAKELGTAVKAYKDAGGSSADIGAAPSATDAGPEAPPSPDPAEAAAPAPDDKTNPYQATLDRNAAHTADAAEDRQFAGEAKRIARQLKAMMAQAKDDKGEHQITGIERDLNAIDGGEGLLTAPAGAMFSMTA